MAYTMDRALRITSKLGLDALQSMAMHPQAVGYENVRWIGICGWIDYSCPSGSGAIKPVGIGLSAEGFIVAGQLPDNVDEKSLPRNPGETLRRFLDLAAEETG